MSDPKTVRCTHCRTEFTDDELEGAHGCPTCGTTSVPCSIANDVEIRINWHELRILCMWAENYASAHLKPGAPGIDPRAFSHRVVSVIAGGIMAQHPELAKRSPLTMTGELAQLKEWADENAGGMQVRGFDPDVEASPELKDVVDEGTDA